MTKPCGACGEEVERLSDPIFTGVPICKGCVYLWREEGFDTVEKIRRKLAEDAHTRKVTP